MTAPQFDPNLLAYLQAWRQYLEQVAGSATMGFGMPTSPQWPMAAPIPMPLPMPPGLLPMPPTAAGPPPLPAAPSSEYAQQLLNTLQAWRQYLEQSAAAPTAPAYAPPSAAYEDSRPRPEKEPLPPPNDGGKWLPLEPRTTPLRQAGSAYAAESSGYGSDGPPVARSLYSVAAGADASAPAATTTWWDNGRPPPSAPSPADAANSAPQNSSTSKAPTNGQKENGPKFPPDVQPVRPLREDASLHPVGLQIEPLALNFRQPGINGP